MLAPVAIGQQLSMLKQNKFIKVYLDLVLTSTYVCSQLKDYDSGNVIIRERLDYEKISDASLLLPKIKKILEIINIDFYNVVEPKFIFDNNYYIFVPDSLYIKGKEKTFLKFNVGLESDDYITTDSIEKLNIYNIYLPYVNINNYLIEKFKKLEFYHYNTVLINKIVSVSNSDSCHCFIENTDLKILIIENGEIFYFNSFSYKTLDDILYYTLLIINDQSFKNKNIPINIHAGKKIDEIKVKFNNFIKNISVIKNNNFAQVL